MSECTWKKKGGRYICQAKHCHHWLKGGGCELGKVSLSCDFKNCDWNKVGHCICMDVHLDSNGKCLGVRSK